MTTHEPPPPAVPGELIEKAAKALHAERCCPLDSASDCVDDFGIYTPERGMATTILAAVYGDIVEAARRDALTELVARVDDLRVSLSPFDAYWHGYVDALSHVADLAYVPAVALSATVSDRQAENAPAPVRDAEGPQIAAEGRGDE